MFISDITKKDSHRAGIKAMIAFISHFLGDNPFTPDAAQSCKMISVEFWSGKEIISDLCMIPILDIPCPQGRRQIKMT